MSKFESGGGFGGYYLKRFYKTDEFNGIFWQKTKVATDTKIHNSVLTLVFL